MSNDKPTDTTSEHTSQHIHVEEVRDGSAVAVGNDNKITINNSHPQKTEEPKSMMLYLIIAAAIVIVVVAAFIAISSNSGDTINNQGDGNTIIQGNEGTIHSQ